MIDWINELFGIKNEVSVPIIISLIVFITGGIVNYSFQKIKEFNERIKLRKTFVLLLNRTQTDLKSKEKNTQKFYKTIKVVNNESWNLTHGPISYLDTFFELNFSDIYAAYRKKFFWSFCNRKKKEKPFHKIWSILRNLKFVESQIEPNMTSMISKFNEYHNKYNDALTSYRKVFDDLMRDTNGTKMPKKEATFLMSQDAIWHKWEQLEENERVKYHITYNQVVKPILELLRNNSDLQITKIFDVELLDCAHQYIQMETLLKSYHTQFYSHYLTYRASRRSLKKASEII